jgi:CCR4-NOT transcription complex subunit 2
MKPLGQVNRDHEALWAPVDLMSLGMNISSSDPIYPTFGAPYSDVPYLRRQPEYRIPECYLVSAPVIKYTLFQKLHIQTVFYIFYSMPRDVLQVAAARELCTRRWRYHKGQHVWIAVALDPPGTAANPNGAIEALPTGANQPMWRGSILIWNVEQWRADRSDNVEINPADLEDLSPSPQAAAAAAAAAQQQQAAGGATAQPAQPQPQGAAPQPAVGPKA